MYVFLMQQREETEEKFGKSRSEQRSRYVEPLFLFLHFLAPYI